MAGPAGISRQGGILYALANLTVWIGACIGSQFHSGSLATVLYVGLLFTLCSVPLLLSRRLNDRHAILGIFMLGYFLYFGGALDLSSLLLGSDVPPEPRDASLNVAELAAITGAAMVLCGYLLNINSGLRAAPGRALREWPAVWVLVIGALLWVLGTLTMMYYSLVVAPAKTTAATSQGLLMLGPLMTFLVMLAHLVQPLGLVMLAYGYARYRGPMWLGLIVIVILTQIVYGFLADIKSQAIAGFALVIIVRSLVDNRMPKLWIACALAFLVVCFPIFQAYRAEITGERGLDRAQALQQIGKVLEIVLATSDKVNEGRDRAQTFLERASSKQVLELLFAHVGEDVEFLNGRSLVAIPMTFVPRLIAPDKEGLSVALLFDQKILKQRGDNLTYISVTQLGEFYWNFGWPGIVVGMLFTGLLLGYLGGRFDLQDGVTLTRVLLLLATAQTLCMGFGGSIEGSYVVWLRSIGAIGIMHWLFARAPLASSTQGSRADPAPTVGTERGVLSAAVASGPRFPNLIR